MSRYQFVFFDLDGTLTDPGVGITNSVAYALEHFGIRVEDKRELYRFIGPPLVASFKKYYGLSDEDAKQALLYYRENYTARGIREFSVYDGMRETLQSLKDAGLCLCLATSKPEPFAATVLAEAGLDGYFDRIAGATLDETRIEKAEVLAYAVKLCHAAPAASVMVGDRSYDMLGAKENGMDAVGVLFGYGDREELTGAGAKYLAAAPAEVASYILGKA